MQSSKRALWSSKVSSNIYNETIKCYGYLVCMSLLSEVKKDMMIKEATAFPELYDHRQLEVT